jgi:hypothetical protein
LVSICDQRTRDKISLHSGKMRMNNVDESQAPDTDNTDPAKVHCVNDADIPVHQDDLGKTFKLAQL